MPAQGQDIPIYIVPDKKARRPQYGDEVPNKNWQGALGALVEAISTYQKENPVNVPAPAGTKTMRQKELDEDTRRYNQEWPYQKRMYEYELNKPYYKPSSGGGDGGGAPDLNQSEKFSATLAGAIDTMRDLTEVGVPMPTDDFSQGRTPYKKLDPKAALNETMKALRQSNTGLSHTQLKELEKQLAAQFGVELEEDGSGTDVNALLEAITNMQ